MTYSCENPSRRGLLRGGAGAAAAALIGIPASSGPAGAFGPPPGQSWADWAEANTPRKSTQRDADYHVASGGRRCANCANFKSPNRCAVVEGANSPEGVCKLYYGARR
ncbi:high potential iron sulfur protein [Blastochloris sulfoviridis]|uniref:High potential iron sulfur protein n=1 Tax=Blastochloris sulfoviridis TaxID=50712 RepID=A0A5M6I296_9HYPH|nr:high potential iron sulfur protein [Blastochloris sulfoviridis]KAA5602283.1 high potential iron sulfur protein [Blastochloris sulfoviridis]